MSLPKPPAALLARAKALYVEHGLHEAARLLRRQPTTISTWARVHGWKADREIARERNALAPELAPDALTLANKRIRDLERALADSQKQALAATAVRQEIYKLSAYEPSPTPLRPAPWHKGRAAGVPLLFLSDLHWGEVVEPAEVLGLNAYNVEIARARLERTFRVAVGLLRNHIAPHAYEEIVVALGGDMVSGEIHEELAHTNALDPSASALDVLDHLLAGLLLLANEFKRVRVVGVAGNHGRFDRKPRAKGYSLRNWDWHIYQLIERALARDKRFSFDFPQARDLTFSVAGKRIRLTHGDQFRGGDGLAGAVTPIRRGEKRKRAVTSMFPTREHDFDILMLGHWHTYNISNSVIVNGSLKSYDEYCLSNNFDYEPAQQALLTIHPQFGVNSAWPIQGDEPKLPAK